MARVRTGTVNEKPRLLQKLEAAAKTSTERSRIALLRLLQQDPHLTFEELSQQLGRSIPTLKRWWRQYREEGLSGFLGRVEQGESEKEEKSLATLHERILSGEVESVEQVREWIDSLHPPLQKNQSSEQPPHLHRPLPTIPQAVITFMNALPLGWDVVSWVIAFRTAWVELFEEVDHISVSINTRCDLLAPEAYRPDLIVQDNASNAAMPLGIGSTEQSHEARLLENFKKQGFEFDRYHPPILRVYHYGGNAYLGTIVLWRERHKRPISRETLDLIKSLEEFIIFLLSDVVVRTHYANPAGRVYQGAVEHLTRTFGLTKQERRVLSLHSLGCTPDEITDILHLSVHTVRSHIRAIYRKTGVHSAQELFSRYLTPRS